MAGTKIGRAARYGGLGAKKAAFLAQNPHGKLPPPLGVAYYALDKVGYGGRVIGYDVIMNFRPRPSSRERIALLAGIDLPDATETRIRTSTCIVWQSAELKKLTGLRYAAGTTRHLGPAIARMRGERVPHC